MDGDTGLITQILTTFAALNDWMKLAVLAVPSAFVLALVALLLHHRRHPRYP